MKDAGESKDHQLTVALRIRPLSDAEQEEGATIVAHRVDDQVAKSAASNPANLSEFNPQAIWSLRVYCLTNKLITT
ncbi:hypothetical protein XENOCAPTIV_020731 [Xenoophorus captivus]|uniref:Kinesin motor domain-containing protein n=1 Tax=Xenoophorus captivus TaxID=1517983 RepID=A0ABV0QW16_9TELE